MARRATRDHHERFCTTEGWTVVTGARGGPVRHHATYELHVLDGSVLRTRISRPVDATGYGPTIWAHILRDQLQVSHEEFWACVDERTLPDRGSPAIPPDALPAGLVFAAQRELGLTDADLATMTKVDLVARMQRHWSSGAPEDQ